MSTFEEIGKDPTRRLAIARESEILYTAELVIAQGEYIALLEKFCRDVAGYLHVHNWNVTTEDVKKGAQLRDGIKRLKEELEKQRTIIEESSDE